MYYSFDVNAAVRYGVEEAVLLEHIRFWCEKNAANPDCQKEGRCWMYASAPRLAEHFPFWRAASAVSPLIVLCGMQSANPLFPCFRIVTCKKRIRNIQLPIPQEQ